MECIVGGTAFDTDVMHSLLSMGMHRRCAASHCGRIDVPFGSHLSRASDSLLCRSASKTKQGARTSLHIYIVKLYTALSRNRVGAANAPANLAVVASHAELQHLIKALAPGEQAAEAPEGASPQAAAAHPLILPIALNLGQGNS